MISRHHNKITTRNSAVPAMRTKRHTREQAVGFHRTLPVESHRAGGLCSSLLILATLVACSETQTVPLMHDAEGSFPPGFDTLSPGADTTEVDQTGPSSDVPADDAQGWDAAVGFDTTAEDLYIPPGVEQCNGEDDDQDGLTDEEDAAGCDDYWYDGDQDGYGVDEPKCLCAPLGKLNATQPGDCLDISEDVNPGMPEDCHNAMDDDCDGDALFPDCVGKDCGLDGCGGECGTCDAGYACGGNQLCYSLCTPQCGGKECGPDGCDGNCGVCAPGHVCSGGHCVCVPNCTFMECGSDGCGGSCGSCGGADTCVGGSCICTPQCGGKDCGVDGCGGSCGSCTSYQTCTQSFQCLGWKWEVETDSAIGHDQGQKEGDGWACNTLAHSQNFMVYGPYTTSVPAGFYEAYFRMMIDNNTAANSKVITLDVNDSYNMDILAEKDIYRQQFNGTSSYQDFSVTFYTDGNDKLELRVEFLDTAWIKVDRIILKP